MQREAFWTDLNFCQSAILAECEPILSTARDANIIFALRGFPKCEWYAYDVGCIGPIDCRHKFPPTPFFLDHK